ncbi:MAG: flavodoxin [Candidatus Bathyarchaeota archaeon]|nr:flavodoxin [Candidatus Bathyarchaeum tardum]WGM90644.1 MAG: flavodoxin [Candidatus Bathyarchaeum tardum]
MKTLVVYFSLTGNTKFVAEKIAEQFGADLCEVTDKTFKVGKMLFIKGGMAAMREKLSDIEAVESIEDYDLVIVGSPVWAGKIAPPIRTFLVNNNFSGKQVAFFVSIGGDKPEKTFENLKKTTELEAVIDGLGVTQPLQNMADAEAQITEWCNNLLNKINA